MFSSDRIFAVMQERGISAYRLAKDLGFSTSQVTIWGKGRSKPTIDALIKVADYLGVSLDYLAGRTDNPKGGIL